MGLENFSAALDLLIGFDIDLYVGDEVVKGKLMGVESDHIVVEDEKKYIFYYSIDKVHAITKNTRQFKGEEPKGNFQKTKSLTELLQSFKNSWVSILSLSKKRFSGVLSDIDQDFATLINGEERILIKLSHISNILKGFIVEEEKTVKETVNNKKENETKNNSEKEKCEKKSKSTSPEPNEKKSKSSPPECNDKKIKHKSEENDFSQHSSGTDSVDSKLGWSEPIKNISPSYSTVNEVKEEKPCVTKIEEHVDIIQDEPDCVIEVMKVEKINTVPMTKKEVKPTKSYESVQGSKKEAKPSKNEAATTVKHDSTPVKTKNETETHNNKSNVWKPRVQEEKIFRFAGEPVSKEEIRPFPFSGWPNRKNRNSRNLFF